MKESMYAKDLKVAFPQFAVVLQEMQNYDLNKKKATPKQETTVPVRSTILSAPSPTPAQTKCTTCSEMFNTTMRKSGTGIYTICFKCSTKARKAREAAAANPTPAQVAGAQASLKKAQAVLLAANVAAKLGHDKDVIAQAINDPAVKERLKTEIDAAVERGVFGSPYVIVDGEPFWGSDRLSQIGQWLEKGPW